MVMANIGSEQDDIAVTLSAGDNPAMQDSPSAWSMDCR
jgi:hypothetical protein